MKHFFLLAILYVCLFSPTNSFGQAPLEARISINIKDQPLESSLYLLIDQHGVKLSFSNSILPENHLVTLQFSGASLATVLDQMLEGTGLVYKVVGTQVVITRKPVKNLPVFFTLSGYVVDQETGESVIGAVIFDELHGIGTYSNDYGFFSINLPAGRCKLLTSNLSYQSDTSYLDLKAAQSLSIELRPALLTEVIVSSFSDSTLLETDFNKLDFNLRQAKKLSSLGGENDIIRLAYSLPGIQTGTDGFGGVSVRGGNVDQNLFLLDGVPVYNAMHGLGLYSIYNTSAIRSASILRGNFPAEYGGRISSIWDIHTKEGNTKEFRGEFEAGSSSILATLEGPLPHGRGAYIVSTRRALFDFISVPVTRKLRQQKGADGYLKYLFYDVNLKANYRLSPNDQLYLSIYGGRDDYFDKYDQYKWFQDTLSSVSDREQVRWGNNVGALRWNHVIQHKLFSNTTLTYSQYFYRSEDLVDLDLQTNQERITRDVLYTKYNSEVKDLMLKNDIELSFLKYHRIKFGGQVARHAFQPGIVSIEEATIIDSIKTEYLKSPLISGEYDAYVQDEVHLTDFIDLQIGLRASALSVNKTWFKSLQPRASILFFGKSKTSFHASVCRVTQFLHLLSPSNIGLPKDLWVSATAMAPPQQSWQFLAGAKRHFNESFTLELEAYYKTLDNLVYFEGNGLETTNAINWQNNISLGKGWAYGAELLLKMERERTSGWISYTWAKADRQFGEEVNNGRKFPIRLDRRHNASLQFLYKINPAWEFSSSFSISTGAAYSFPSQVYELYQPNGSAPTAINPTTNVISELNGERLPLYHRLDFSFNHSFLVRQVPHSLKLGVYNAYFRKNPVYYTIRDNFDEDGVLTRQKIKVTLLPFFPILRYSIQF